MDGTTSPNTLMEIVNIDMELSSEEILGLFAGKIPKEGGRSSTGRL